MEQQRPTRRMSDMGPRRPMDGIPRPAAGGPAPSPATRAPGMQSGYRSQPQPRPEHQPQPRQRDYPQQPQPVRRPMAPGRDQQLVTERQMRERDRYEGYEDDDRRDRRGSRRSDRAERPARSGGGWRTILQFVVGLLIIAGVAFAIVALYIRYYQ